jgi:hypothetical protein
MVHFIRNYWSSGLFPSSSILKEHDVSVIESVSILKWEGGETRTDLGPLERANLD